MRFVVQVRPFRHPHHEADVLIPVSDPADVDRLTRWFVSQGKETETVRLDTEHDRDAFRRLQTADQLVMSLEDLRASGHKVLRCAIENGERMRRADRRATYDTCRPAPPAPQQQQQQR